MQTRTEITRWSDWFETARCHQGAANTRVMRGAGWAGLKMLVHRLLIDTREGVVNER
ncbi:MAG TPA: hypothetical protein VJ717_07935 [Gemmatimonadaceae bacterium]|nr:hypothetical protein [Gemmatimonadaceae bacterium]